MRQVVLDIETTGLSFKKGDRLIEVGCVEIIDNEITGKFFHQYVNPERDVPLSAYRIHGISTEDLLDKKKFVEIAPDLLKFIKNSDLIIHNAKFDVPFLNFELQKIQYTEIANDVIDTLVVARKKFPGAKASLDALCKKFKIDISNRKLHGALKDALLLAKVYFYLAFSQQEMFQFGEKISLPFTSTVLDKNVLCVTKPSKAELEEHQELLKMFFD